MEFNGFEDLRLDLRRFERNLGDIDIEKVEQETLREAAQELAKMVRQAIVAEPEIVSPAMNSEYERGPGPSMASSNAWLVIPDGNGYVVRPHPSVEQRAYVLNYGYPGRIYPKNAQALRFTIDGLPVFRAWVPGPNETGYWEAAIAQFEKSSRLSEIAEEKLEEEIEDNL